MCNKLPGDTSAADPKTPRWAARVGAAPAENEQSFRDRMWTYPWVCVAVTTAASIHGLEEMDKRRKESSSQHWVHGCWESNKMNLNGGLRDSHGNLLTGQAGALRRCQTRLLQVPGPFRSSPAQAWAMLGRCLCPETQESAKQLPSAQAPCPARPQQQGGSTLLSRSSAHLGQALGPLSPWHYLPHCSAHPQRETPASTHTAVSSRIWQFRSCCRKRALHLPAPCQGAPGTLQAFVTGLGRDSWARTPVRGRTENHSNPVVWCWETPSINVQSQCSGCWKHGTEHVMQMHWAQNSSTVECLS